MFAITSQSELRKFVDGVVEWKCRKVLADCPSLIFSLFTFLYDSISLSFSLSRSFSLSPRPSPFVPLSHSLFVICVCPTYLFLLPCPMYYSWTKSGTRIGESGPNLLHSFIAKYINESYQMQLFTGYL